MIPWLLAGCEQDPPAGADPTASTPSPPVFPVEEALSDRCPDPTPAAVLGRGATLHRVTLSDAVARCNDGSPPVLYVRGSTDPEHAADWLVHLNGGGYCDGYETCAERWCGEGSYDAANMSSRWAPETADGRGVMSAEPANPLAGFQVAQLYYCTSDLWIGREPAVTLDGDPPFTLSFAGHEVIGEALAALAAGVVSDDGEAQLPPLVDPHLVVLSGSSAGAYGAVAQLGRFVDAFPGSRVVGAPDAIFSPSPESLSPALASAWSDAVAARYDGVLGPLWSGYVDAACLASGERPATCSDVHALLTTYRRAEVAYHHDLRDPVLYDTLARVGASLDEYAAAGEATLRGYAALDGVGVHGANCALHTAYDDDRAWFGEVVTDPVTGEAAAPSDVLRTVLGGAPISAIDTADGGGSQCGP